MAEHYDVIVIGGGAVGENVAARAAQHGLKVALVEKHLLGGECSYYACMPSKALLRPGEALEAARRVPGAREAINGQLNSAACLARRNALASHWNDRAQAAWLRQANVELFRGHGRLTGERTVAVAENGGDRQRPLQARHAVVLATGSLPAIPPIEGLNEIRTWTSRDLTTAATVPKRLLLIGGGVVGVEMAQAWRRLGSEEVTLVERGERLLADEEPFASTALAEALRREGIEIRLNTQLTAAHQLSDRVPLTAQLDDGTQIDTDVIAVAAGRKPATQDLGLASVGLEPGAYLETDDQLRVRNCEGNWLYAVGDCNGRNLLTHMGKYQARVAGDVIAGKSVTAWADSCAVPRIVFTDPLIAAVGHTKASARQQGYHLDTVRYDISDVAGAVIKGEHPQGASQLVIDSEREILLGATFTGPGVDELLHAATIAIAAEIPLATLAHAVPSFPTISEVWLRLLEKYGL